MNSLQVPTNTVLLTNLPFGHPRSELEIRFSQFGKPVIMCDPLNYSKATICFDSTREAILAAQEYGLSFGPTLNYNKLFAEQCFRQERLQVPLNEKNWLISPPPSPPRNWKQKTEGTISHTLPFFDLPSPRLIQEESEDQPATYLIYTPPEDADWYEDRTQHVRPIITVCQM